MGAASPFQFTFALLAQRPARANCQGSSVEIGEAPALSRGVLCATVRNTRLGRHQAARASRLMPRRSKIAIRSMPRIEAALRRQRRSS